MATITGSVTTFDPLPDAWALGSGARGAEASVAEPSTRPGTVGTPFDVLGDVIGLPQFADQVRLSPLSVMLVVGQVQTFRTQSLVTFQRITPGGPPVVLDSIPFSADFSVTEGASGGTLNVTSGTVVVYTAPLTPGTYHLQATDPADGTNYATATIQVVDRLPRTALPPEILESTRFGVQADVGTEAATPWMMRGVRLALKPQANRRTIKRLGTLASYATPIRRDWTEGDFTAAQVHLADLVVLLAAHLCLPTFETPDGASVARRFRFSPSAGRPDAVRSLTAEKGQATGTASRLHGLRVNDLAVEISRRGANIKGRALGSGTRDGITLTPDPAYLPKTPIDPRTASVWLGTSLSTLAVLGQAHDLSLTCNPRFRPLYRLSPTGNSIDDYRPQPANLSGSVVVPHTSIAADFLTELLTAETGLIRVEMAGSVMSDGMLMQATWTFPFRFLDTARQASQDVHAARFGFEAVFDETFGGWLEIVIDTLFPDALGAALAA